jgi:hypothetical protein
VKHFFHACGHGIIVLFALILYGLEAWAEDEGTGYPGIFGPD